MEMSFADHLGAADRALSTVERDGREVRLLTVTRSYAAPPADVWDALTSAERIPRWFVPVTGDLVVGGRYQLEDQAGGEVLACEPPTSLSITWEFNGDVSWVDVSLTAGSEGAGTLLRLEHSAPVNPQMWAQYGPGAVGIGGELGLVGLAEHLAVPPDVPTHLSEMIAGANDAWVETSIAAGTDLEAARAAGERCAAAYLGTEAGSGERLGEG